MHEIISTEKAYLSNEAINAGYDYNASEIDLMVNIIQAIKPANPNNFSVINLKLGQLIAHLNDDAGSAYTTIKTALYNLQRKPYEIYFKETKKLFIANFISSAEIDRYTGNIQVTMHPKIRQIVCDIKEQYTSFEIGNLLLLKGKYAKRFYMLLNQFKSTGVRFATMGELRTMFKTGDKYPDYKEFKRRVIDPAMDEISSKTDLIVKVEAERLAGRKVDSFNILVKLKKEAAAVSNLDKQQEYMKRCGLSDWQIDNVLMTLDRQTIYSVLYALQTNANKIQNKGGYLNSVFIAHGVVMNKKLPKQIDLIDQINYETSKKR